MKAGMASAGRSVDVLVGAGGTVQVADGISVGVSVGAGVGTRPQAENSVESKKEKRSSGKGEKRRVVRAGGRWRFIGVYFTLPDPLPALPKFRPCKKACGASKRGIYP